MKPLRTLTVLLVASSVACARPLFGPSDPPPAAPPTAVQEDEEEDDQDKPFDHAHTPLDQLLRRHVKLGMVDYKGVIAGMKKLNRYIRNVTAVTPEEMATWTREQKYAFWINVYNAHVLKLIAENYPVDSIKDIGGAVFNRVWDKEFIELQAFHPKGDDDKLSLDDVEHGILRPQFQDARIHAAVNCASFSCPVLMDEAFVADRLDEQLDRQMRLFVNDRERNLIDHENGILTISEIFKWFEEDFERDMGSVKNYLAHYSAPEAGEFIQRTRLRYINYDWSLNDVPPESP